jgi:hypothetical protein
LRRVVLPLRDGPLHAHAGKSRASVAHAALAVATPAVSR